MAGIACLTSNYSVNWCDFFLADSEEEELNVEDEMALDGGKQSDSDVCEFVSF